MKFSTWAKPSVATALGGLCATLIGLGIGRFSYVAILPLLVDAHWTDTSGATQIAAANLIGYLFGALLAHRTAILLGAGTAIRFAMGLILVSLVACALPFPLNSPPLFYWLWSWRFLAGAGGGLLMILAAPFIMARVPVSQRGKAVGLVFSGIGWGIVISGLAVPALGANHLVEAWLVLALVVGLAMLLAWPKFSALPAIPGTPAPPGTHATKVVEPHPPSSMVPRGALLTLLFAYMLDGVGYLPHTVLWVEYLVHGLGMPLATGGLFWAVFGVGAICGPLVTGFAADHFGFRRTVIAVFALKAIGVALPLISSSFGILLLSSFMVGALTPGLVAVASGRVLEIVGPSYHQRSWALLTFVYASLQALGGYGMARLYGATHSFTLLFALGAGALALAALLASLGESKTVQGSISGEPA